VQEDSFFGRAENFSVIPNRYLHFGPLSLFLGGVARFFYFLLLRIGM
jgi:hypothetical protein